MEKSGSGNPRKSRLNAEWHKKHPMPKNPTMEQRAKWHLEHYKHCACREIPATVLEYLERKK